MIRTAVTVWAFLKRDFLSEVSYRLSFLLQVFGLVLSVAAFYFLTKMIDPATEGLDGIPPFEWLLMGVSFQAYFSTALYAFSARIRDEQVLGTLEAMLVSSAPTSVVIFASAAWDFTYGGIRVVLYLAIAWLLFDYTLYASGLAPLLVGILLTMAWSVGIGILSAAFILYFKRGNPINMLLSGMSLFFGNVFFPSAQLPDWIEPVAAWVPVTWSLNVVRGALLKGEGFEELAGDLTRLAVLAAVLLPAGLFLARIAVRRAKREGSLVQY